MNAPFVSCHNRRVNHPVDVEGSSLPNDCPPFDIIIAGGGLIGLSAAIAMRQRGFSVAIVDAGSLTTDTAHTDARVYALNQASLRLLNDLDVGQKVLQSRVSPYAHMHVWDAANGAHIDFDSRMIGTDKLGVIIEESVLKQAALQQAMELGIECFPYCRIQAVQSTENGIHLQAESQTWSAKLLIVADGPTSTTREQLGVSITSWPYHQHAIVATVKTEKPHQHTAYQVFNPDGPLAFLPLIDPHQCSIVWSTSTQHAQHLMTLTDAEFSHQLTLAFNQKLGACNAIGKRHPFPLIMRHAKQYSGSNWLLMGDAAHTIHPLAGLGLNVGLADLTCWLKHLDRQKQQALSQKILSAYQRERKHAVWQTIALMGGLKTLFANPLPPVTLLRGLGLNACNHLSPLKRLFIEHAAG